MVKWPKTPASHAGNTSSNLVRVTIPKASVEFFYGFPSQNLWRFFLWVLHIVGVDGGEGTPVPIPNTAVKLTCADNTWLEAAWEDKQMPTQIFLLSSVGRACGC